MSKQIERPKTRGESARTPPGLFDRYRICVGREELGVLVGVLVLHTAVHGHGMVLVVTDCAPVVLRPKDADDGRQAVLSCMDAEHRAIMRFQTVRM